MRCVVAPPPVWIPAVVRRVHEAPAVHVHGVVGAARGHVAFELAAAMKRKLVCLTADEDAADSLFDDLSFFFGADAAASPPAILRLPFDDALPWDELSESPAVQAQRLSTLFWLSQASASQVVVLSLRALSKRVFPLAQMNALSDVVGPGQEVGRDALVRKLYGLGYRHAPLVEDIGQTSVRGDLVDVFSPLHARPVRLEFFGDTIESMREFDPETQKTVEPIAELVLVPAREVILSEATLPHAEAALRHLGEAKNLPTSALREKLARLKDGQLSRELSALLPGVFQGGLSTVRDYLTAWNRDALYIQFDPSSYPRAMEEHALDLVRSKAHAEDRGQLGFGIPELFVEPEKLLAELGRTPGVAIGGVALGAETAAPVNLGQKDTHSLKEALRSHHGEESALTPLLEALRAWADEGYFVSVACGSRGQADRISRLLGERGVKLALHEGPFSLEHARAGAGVLAHLYTGEVSVGFIDDAAKRVVLSQADILGQKARRTTRRRSSGLPELESFRELNAGDLVVHADFGVCRYDGLLSMEVGGVKGDFLALHFAGKDKIYLPVSRLRLVSRFTGGDPEKVTLDRLGSGGWERTRARVKENLLKIAAELLKLYAERRAHPGHRFSAPDKYFHQFEAEFEFEETPDQQKAIDDVIADMQKPEPMDRLICGDVGYGKTEVAMRAAFKCVLDRKQVAVLTPTTILAHQHHATFSRRFSGYPVTIEVVSGMKKPAEVREILNRANEGRLDILIGTHKLLGSQVGFKDLGLLIVDEEQKFGVKQKESLKRLKAQVDALTLSATPIPRTLNMAMAGLRDMSLIATPPLDRRAIRTFVLKFDTDTIRDAITREVQRGGQVFFVHNRVQSIGSMYELLKQLVPGVTIGVAHGQMAEGQLEPVMLDFINKRIQVLLCTSIIESGLDIPAANTMIVNRADAFGLSQLYQLRGRVGRSNERAYAYLLIPTRKAVTKDAERRLEVLQAFTELGAGFQIASHDLEIRGAGSLLGQEQSGAIEAVGFDLYEQLLEEAVAELKGSAARVHVEPDVNLPVPALIPEDYVPDVHQRLVLYKRFAQASSEEDLEQLRIELVDRFGDAPDEVDALERVMLLKTRLRRLGLRSLDAGPGKLVLTLGHEALLDPAKIATLVAKSKGLYRLTPEMKLVASIEGAVAGTFWFDAARKVLKDVEACAA